MKKIILTILSVGVLAFNSCGSLDVTPPNAISDPQITAILEGDDEAKITDVLNAIGGGLAKYFNWYSSSYTGYSALALNTQVDQEFIRSMLGNDVILGQKSDALKGGHFVYYDLESKNWQDITNNQLSAYWNMPVDFYSAANKVLKFITADIVAKKPSLKRNRADALVTRAWGYLLLVERFAPAYAQVGDAPALPIYTEYKVNAAAEISGSKVVYENIISWLKEAIDLYESSGVKYTTDVYNDIDEGVARYLLMRAALEFTDWDTVIENGEKLIEKYNKFIPVANYGASSDDLDAYAAGTKEINAKNNAFVCAAANPEAILAFPYGGLYNRQDMYVYGNAFTASIGKEFPRIDDRLYNQILSNDVRKKVFTDHAVNYTFVSNADENITNTIEIPQYTTLKWAATQALTETKRTEKTYSDDIVIRSSEVYLMLAEAYAQKNDSKAASTLKKLTDARAVSGTLNYPTTDILQAIKLQWRIEMWLEKGIEFNNNKRWGVAVDRSGSSIHYSTGKTLSVDDMTIHAPADEQRGNPNWAKVY